MTIGSIGAGNWFAQLSQLTGLNQPMSNNGNGPVAASPSADPRGGGMLRAISAALSQIGVTGNGSDSTSGNAVVSASTISSTSSPQGQAQAVANFLQSLMAALQAQSGQSANAASPEHGTAANTAAGVNGTHSARHHHHRHDMQAAIQSLLQQLSSSGNATAGTAMSGTAATNTISGASGTTDPTLSTLQQSFQNLVSVFGGANSSATLSKFLQAFSSDMPGTPAAGDVIRTEA